jgi:hypothetical protein
MFLKWPSNGKITMACVKHLNKQAEIELLSKDMKLTVSIDIPW